MKSLRTKIFFGYILLTVITVLVGGWAIFNFLRLSTALEGILQENYLSVVAAEHMMDALERQDSAQLLLLSGREEEAKEIFIENEHEFIAWLNRAEENITIANEKPLIMSIKADYNRYTHTFYTMRDIYLRGEPEELSAYYFSGAFPLFQQIKNDSRRLLEVNQEAMINENQRAKFATRKAIVSTGAVSLVAVALGLLLGINLVRLILYPVNLLTDNVRKVREGRLDDIVEIHAQDEIGELAVEFSRMTKQRREYEKSNVNKLIAEQKRSEAIVRSISDAIVVTDAESRILLVNEKAEEIFSIQEESAVGQHFLEVINNEKLFKTTKEALTTGNPAYTQGSQELIHVKVEGEDHFYQVEVTPVKSPDGQLLGTVTLLPDITHFKAVDRMKSDFVSTVSHEFRSPLATIQMGVELLIEQHQDNMNYEGREMLAAVYEDAQRLNRLVNDLLDLSKMEEGKISMTMQDVFVEELVDSAILTLKKQGEAKGVNLTKDIQPDLPLIEADINKMIWVLTNLVGNALRYTDSGGKITISARVRGNRVYISVSDTGTGIPKEYLDKIFEKFVQVKGKNGASGGAGLGLTIAREIVQAHRGRIWVESEAGQGATFTFTIPVKPLLGGGENKA